MSEVLLDYWQQRLAIPEESLNLPIDKSRIDSVRSAAQAPLPSFSEELQQDLEALAKTNSLPLPIVYLSAFYSVLFHYSGQKDLCIGTSSRLLSDDLNSSASASDLMPAVVQLDPSVTFIQFAHMVHGRFDADVKHWDGISLNEIVRNVEAAEDSSTELFRAAFSFVLAQDDKQAHPAFQGGDPGLAGVECQLELNGNNSGVTGLLHYRADLFDRETMERFANHYTRLLECVTRQPDLCVGKLELLGESERLQLIVGMNQTQIDYPKEKTISQLFSEQALVNADSVAVRGPDDRTLSYAQLEQASNRLAAYLVSRGVGSGKRVGVYLERGVEMVSTLLAVMKSGAAYVPLDPMFPADRLSYMADDAELELIVTQSSLVELVPIQGCELVALESWYGELDSHGVESVERSEAGSAAYVIYTSGSTGQPKGVQVSHRALVNFLCTMRHVPGLSANDNLLAVTTLSFDIAGLELYLPLLVGAQVTLASREEAMDPQRLSSRLLSCDASVMQATPATWKMLIESGWSGCRKLRVWCGGEAMSRDLADDLLDASEEVWNLYGPTETTIWSTVWRVEKGVGTVPVGAPIGNTQVYVLDESGQLVAPGVSGELYIGGDGVADGYLNRESLTAERFVEDRFSTVVGSRLYRTGDRVRWRSDGQLEVQGRLDDQVKLRGYRIELGEIRAALVERDSVRDAVVVVREDGSRGAQLVAYLLSDSGHVLDIDELRRGLMGRMPEYMVPSKWVELDEFPLTPNGKVDKKQLPANGESVSNRDSYSAPRTATEKQLALIWQELLGVDVVDRQDQFFVIGGNSLRAIQLVSRIRNGFNVNVPLGTLFRQSMLCEVSQLIDDLSINEDQSSSSVESPSIPLADRTGVLPLSYAQERLWFLDQLEGPSELYNVPVAIRIRGTLDEEALEKALVSIVDRHEALRTQILTGEQGNSHQVVTDAQLHLEKEQVTGNREQCEDALEEIIYDEVSSVFELSASLKIKATLVKIVIDGDLSSGDLSSNEYLLLVNMHHIASDAWSIGLLTKELSISYSGLVSNDVETEVVPSLPVQYVDYVNWQREWLHDDRLKGQVDYWKKHLAGAPSLLELPTDFNRPELQSNAGSTKSFVFSRELLGKLNGISNENDATLFMTLLAAFSILLSRYSGSDDIVVGSPMANRSVQEVEPLIGFFVNTLVLRTQVSGENSFNELIGQVRDTALAAFQNQDVPFEKLVEELQPERNTSYSPLFQVLFQLQNAPSSKITMTGVEAELLQLEEQTAKCDLTLGMYETDEGLNGWINFNSSLFKSSTIERMVRRLELLLEGLASTPEEAVQNISIPGLSDSKLVQGTRTSRVSERAQRTSSRPGKHSGKDSLDGGGNQTIEPQTESEVKIAAIWSNILEIESVGVNKSFFEMGGHSLLAIKVVTKIRDQLGLELSLLELFQGATVASMAERLDEKAAVKSHPTQDGPATCRLLANENGKNPFFILGSNPRYAQAAADLDPQTSVYQLDAYALQVVDRIAKNPVPNTIEKIAAAILSEVKLIQPHGPYRLGGGCEGALIALEIALMLQREGEQVEKLMTWHTIPPGPLMKKEFGGSSLRRFSWQLRSVFAKGKSARLGMRGYKELIRHELIEYSLLAAMFKYRPNEKFLGDMDLVVLEPDDTNKKVTGVDDVFYEKHIKAWRGTVSGDMDVSLLKGTHDTWLADHVDVFSQYLVSRLKNVGK